MRELVHYFKHYDNFFHIVVSPSLQIGNYRYNRYNIVACVQSNENPQDLFVCELSLKSLYCVHQDLSTEQ